MYYSITNPSGTCANKSTTTKQSLASLAGMLTWHVNSSPCAFSARGDYVTICTSPFFFFFFAFPFLSHLSILSFSLQTTYQHTHLHSYLIAILEQPRARLLPTPFDTLVPIVLFVTGQIFIAFSTWSLGITGRFLGDYFGIIMDARVKSFPYNVLRDPIYISSTMCFAATALWCVPHSRSLNGTRKTV